MTQSTKQAWYHCGKCGSLFEAVLGYDEKRVCSLCEKAPGTGIWAAEDIPSTDVQSNQNIVAKQPEVLVDEDGRRAVRKKRKGNVMMKIVVVWTFLMLMAVWLRHYYTQTASEKEKLDQIASRMTKGTLADESVALLNKALPDCHRALGGFLAAGTPEGRNQFVADPINTAGKMAIFYAFNSFPKVDVENLQRIGQEVINVGSTRMVLTRWKEKDGVEFDAVFRRHAGTWRLDWDHFSQYSEYPWTLFLTGDGPEEAEFRLLARQKLTESDLERIGSRLIFSMFAPVFGKAGETGMESPDFVIDRQSDEGLLIGAALKDRANGDQLFGRTIPPLHREGDIRVHVRVKRNDQGGQRTFTLEEVIACHWINSEEAGYDLEELRDDLFGN